MSSTDPIKTITHFWNVIKNFRFSIKKYFLCVRCPSWGLSDISNILVLFDLWLLESFKFLNSVSFLKECLEWEISPTFCRLTKTNMNKNGLEFDTVKRIEMSNLKRELGYQSSRAKKLTREKEILNKLKGVIWLRRM